MSTSAQLPRFRRILLAIDRSIASRRATDFATRLAAETGARVAVVHVIDLSRGFSPEFGFADETTVARRLPVAEELLGHVAAAFKSGVTVDWLIREGEPAQEIVAAADQWGADLIIVGTHGYGRLARLLLGSTAETVARFAHCPVLRIGSEPTADDEAWHPTRAALATEPCGPIDN